MAFKSVNGFRRFILGIGLAAILLAVSHAVSQFSAMHLRILVVKDAADARKIATLLAQGESFARLASEYSIHLTKKRGGRLGRVGLDKLQEQVRAKIGALEVGAVIGPMQIQESLAFFQRTTVEHYAEGVRLMRAKQYREALVALANDLALNPDRLHSLELKAYAYEQLGQMSEAETAYREVIQQDSKNVLAHNNLGALFERSGQYAKAAQLFEQAIILDPTQHVILYNLAWLYAFELSKPGKALGFIQQAITRQPATARYYAVLGKIYKQQGELQQARLAIGRAVELALNETEYRDELASLGMLDDSLQAKKASALIKMVVHPGGADASRRIVQLLQQNGFAIDRQIRDAEPRQGLRIYHKSDVIEIAWMIRDLIDPALQPRRITWSSQFDIIIYAGR